MTLKGQRNTAPIFIGQSGLSAVAPELTVSIIVGTVMTPIEGVLRGEMETLTFVWSENADDFTEGDIRLEWFDARDLEGSLTGFMGADGTDTMNAVLNVPDNSHGEVDVIINANVATATADSSRYGPPRNTVKTVRYDTRATALAPPTVNILTMVDGVEVDDIAGTYDVDNPWKSVIFLIVMRWSEDVDDFIAGDVSADVGTESDFDEVSKNHYTETLTLPDNAMGTCTITITEDSATGAETTGPAMDYSETFHYDTRGLDKDIPNTTTLCEHTYDFADNPHITGAFCNVMEMIVHSGFVYFIVQIVRDRDSMPTNFLAWDTVGASLLMRVPVGGGDCDLIASFDDVFAGARSLCVYDGAVHYFRGSHYAYRFEDSIRPEDNLDWRGEIGGFYKLENGTTPVLVARAGRTGQDQELLPGDEDYDPFYSVRGGMLSPLTPDGDELFYVAGFGDVREIGAHLIANTPVDDIRNWELVKLTETLETRVPVLETNGHPGWENIKQLAQLTRSRIGFRGDEFRLEPAAPRTALIKTAITDSATTIELKDFSRSDIPDSGTLFIQGELITYTGKMGDNLTGLTRGAFETTADGYAVDDTVVFVDHRVSEYLSLSLSNDPSRIYNHVTVRYGEDQEFTAQDDTSIDAYGQRQLELTLPIGPEQTAWAEHLAKSYLADFKDAKTVVSLTIEMDTDLEIGANVFIKQTDRAHLFSVGQIVEIKHNISGRQRNRSQTTELKLILI